MDVCLKKETFTSLIQKAVVTTMCKTLHRVRFVALTMILAGAVNSLSGGENPSPGQTQSAGQRLSAPSSAAFTADASVANSYGHALPVPETPDIILGMAGIGVMLMLRRFIKR